MKIHLLRESYHNQPSKLFPTLSAFTCGVRQKSFPGPFSPFASRVSTGKPGKGGSREEKVAGTVRWHECTLAHGREEIIARKRDFKRFHLVCHLGNFGSSLPVQCASREGIWFPARSAILRIGPSICAILTFPRNNYGSVYSASKRNA